MIENKNENGNDIRRRSILALAGAATAATSGCLDILGLNNNDDSDDSNGGGSDGGQSDAPQPNDTAKPQQNQTRNQNETRQENETNSTNETGHQRDSNDTEEEEKEKRQLEPTDEETTVNRSKYDETSVRETVARPESDVEIAGTSPYTMPDGTVTVAPTITNVSDEAIDFVDLDIYYLDANENEVGHSTAIVRDLAPNETKGFSGSIRPANLDGEVDDTRVEASPQDYVSS